MTDPELAKLAINITAQADTYADLALKAQTDRIIAMYGTTSLILYALSTALANTLKEGAPHDSHPNS